MPTPAAVRWVTLVSVLSPHFQTIFRIINTEPYLAAANVNNNYSDVDTELKRLVAATRDDFLIGRNGRIIRQQ